MAFACPTCYSFPGSLVAFSLLSALRVVKHADSALRQLRAVAAPKKSGHYAKVAAAGGNESWDSRNTGRRTAGRGAIGTYIPEYFSRQHGVFSGSGNAALKTKRNV